MMFQIFTFSPVQKFIEKSRRLSDLFFSSYLLSYLTERMIEEIEKLGGKVIYPAKAKGSEKALANYPNRVLFMHEECLCGRMEEAFKNTWREVWEKVIGGLPLDHKVFEQAKLHLENYFKAYCECAKEEEGSKLKETLNRDGEDYGYTYTWLEMKLGAKKSKKPYKPFEDGLRYEGRYPDGCSLCGERAHLSLDWKSFREGLDKRLRHFLNEGEKLCGVCLVKRYLFIYFKNLESKFPSTEDVANYGFKKKLESMWYAEDRAPIFDELRNALHQYTGRFLELPEYEVDFFIPENLKDEEAEELKELLERFYREYAEKPSKKYFCLILSDGDRIGEWLGLESGLRDKPLTEDFHKDFSERLSGYASRIKDEAKDGVFLIYGGGDDIMAVSDVRSTFGFLKRLDGEFKRALGGKASVSAGVVIAHSKDNLRYILELLREAERKAKTKAGRSAFCIYAVPRNGSLANFCAKWEHLDTFMELIELFENQILGDKTVYDLKDMSLFFEIEQNKEKLKEVVIAMLRRMLRRRIDDKKLRENKEEYINSLLKKLDALAEDLENLANMFYIARFVARERRVKKDEVSIA